MLSYFNSNSAKWSKLKQWKYKELLSIEKSIVIRINHTTDYNNYNELLNGEYKE